MRKYIVTTLVLVCIAAGGILWSYLGINSQQDDITVKETIEAGKAEATKDIKVTTKIQDDEYDLNWTTDMFLSGGKDVKTKTEFTYDPQKKVKMFEDLSDTYYVMDKFSQHFIHLASWDTEKEEFLDTGLPMKLVEDAYKASGEEESFVSDCYLDDYVDYLPVELDVNSYDYGKNLLQMSNDDYGNPIDWTSYFQFPVPEKFLYQVGIDKESRIADTSIAISLTAVSENDGGFYYDVCSDGFWDGKDLYLAVSGIEETGTQKILSSAPAGKRGIHRIPTKSQQYTYLELAKGRLVYSIDEEELVLRLRESEDGKTLFLLTKSPDGLALHVIDKETFQRRQKLDLNQKVNGKEFYLLKFAGEKGIFLLFERGVFLFLDEENGVYKEVLTNTIGHPEEAPYIDCDYDGERLAIALIDWESNVIETQLHVFDKDGSLYSGRFDYSHAQYYYDEEYGSGYEKRVFVEFTEEI